MDTETAYAGVYTNGAHFKTLMHIATLPLLIILATYDPEIHEIKKCDKAGGAVELGQPEL